MRFKKGSKVEVLNKIENPAGSWWCAEIISGNGHNYYVRYDHSQCDVGSSVERVPRRAIRPCPPSEKGRLDWIPGDIVEVFNNFSWMLAKIIMFSGGECFSVRFLGSSTKLIVHSSAIRLGKCWKDNKWVIFQTDSAKCYDKTVNGLSKEKFISYVPQKIDDMFQVNKNLSVQDTSQPFELNVKKRARICSRPLEECNGASRKIMVVEKEGFPQGSFAWNSTWEKVDAVTSPQTLFGEKYKHSSLINRNTGIYETNQVVRIENAESISSSVGSCNVNKSPCRSRCHPFYGTSQYMESHHDPSESSASFGRETSFAMNEALYQGIHNLELHAYHCTMSALYASGPISWEQEALLTNLRLMLHISNDEHLTELKNLVSTKTNDFLR